MASRNLPMFTLVAALSSAALIGCSSGGTNPLPTFGCTQNCTQPPADSGAPSNGMDSGSMPVGMDSGSGVPDAMMTTQNATWADGHQISSSVAIAAGVTITIAPGAKVTVANGATIVVNGTLTASSATPTHASLSGSSWGGIVVASGGTLSLDGVDITGASTALHTQGGNGTSTYNDSTITGAATPFQVDVGSQLSTTHGTVAGTLGSSTIDGTLTA